MNHETCLEDDKVERRNELEEAQRAESAIRCRKIRLYIAAHPGTTFKEMKEHFGHMRLCVSLNRLDALGLIRAEVNDTAIEGKRKWFVVPQ